MLTLEPEPDRGFAADIPIACREIHIPRQHFVGLAIHHFLLPSPPVEQQRTSLLNYPFETLIEDVSAISRGGTFSCYQRLRYPRILCLPLLRRLVDPEPCILGAIK